MAENPNGGEGDLSFYAGDDSTASETAILIEQGSITPTSQSNPPSQPTSASNSGLDTLLQNKMAGAMFSSVFESTKAQVGMYGNIEAIRPFFDVEPKEVGERLLHSLHPKKGALLLRSQDLYTPLMLAFTLVAVLLLGMKVGNHHVQDGTLMGTAMMVTFSYWWTSALVLYAAAYLLEVPVRVMQVLSVTGYALFGVCLTLLAGCFVSHTGVFYLALFTFGARS